MRGLGVGPGVGKRLGKGLRSETIAWQARVAAVSGTYTAAELAAVNQWYADVAAAGLTGKIKRANLNVGNLACQRVCLFSEWGTASVDTIQGTPTVSSRGLILDTSLKYVRTGIIPATQTGWNGQDMHIAAQVTEGNTTGANTSLFGCWSNSGARRLGVTWTTAGTIFADTGANGEAVTNSGRTRGFESGHILLNALSGVGCSYWENGVNSKGEGAYSANATAATVTGWPSTEMNIGRADSSGMNPSCVLAGYHIGTGLTAAEARAMYAIMNKAAQALGRQETWLAIGESTTAAGSSQWCNLVRTNNLPRRAFSRIATGGITSTTLLNDVRTALAANPGLKYCNVVGMSGVNDSSNSNWDGSDTLANMAAIRAEFPHNSFRILSVLIQNRPSDYTGGAKRIIKNSVNTQFAATYGSKYVDVNTPLIAGGTGSGQDLVDANNGVVPSSLKASTIWNITAISKANPARVTIGSTHTASAGDVVTIAGAGGMTEINGLSAYVATPSSSFLDMTGINSTAFTTYTSGGTATGYDPTHMGVGGDTIIANTFAATLPVGGGSWI